MKQLFWNISKLLWVIVACYGYVLHYNGEMGAELTMVWVGSVSVALAAVYSFLSAYRLGPSTELGEFIPKSEIAEFNPNQWLFRAWTVLSLAIILPAYHYRPIWVIIAPVLLVFALMVTISLLSLLGRHYHRMIQDRRHTTRS